MSASHDHAKKTGRKKPGFPADMKGVARVTSAARDSEPKFRSVALFPKKPAPMGLSRVSGKLPGMLGKSIGKPGALGAKKPSEHLEEIDKSLFLSKKVTDKPILGLEGMTSATERLSLKPTNWHVNDNTLRPVPAYYPLEKSSRFITGTEPSVIASKLSECCRVMSVQAAYDHDAATASLQTEEHVEIHLALWRGKAPRYPDCIIVEAQRRKGDAVTYHKYSRNLLDAADGEFDAEEYAAYEERERTYSKMAEKMLEGKKSSEDSTDQENSVLALEIAGSLLKKDRMDARQLGMESLCLLTDPARTGMETALMTSRVVLTGSVQDENMNEDIAPEELGIREAILSLVQFGRLSEDGAFMDEGMDSDDECMNKHPEEQEHNDLLHNLALAVLSNALEVLENHGQKLAPSSDNAASDAQKVASVADAFLDETKEISSRDLLKTLLNGVGKAGEKPHDACLSAQCLNSLCQASKDARKRARNLSAKKVVSTALDVGRRTHVKLETETEKVLKTLAKTDDDDEQ